MRVPVRWHDTNEWIGRIAQGVNQLVDGRVASNSSVTLTANAATTAVKDFRVGTDSVILFMPLTANAAAEQAAGTMYVTAANIAPRSDQFTITHANNAQTDRDFRYIILGAELN